MHHACDYTCDYTCVPHFCEHICAGCWRMYVGRACLQASQPVESDVLDPVQHLVASLNLWCKIHTHNRYMHTHVRTHTHTTNTEIDTQSVEPRLNLRYRTHSTTTDSKSNAYTQEARGRGRMWCYEPNHHNRHKNKRIHAGSASPRSNVVS